MNHMNDFKHPRELMQALSQAWEEMIDCCIEPRYVERLVQVDTVTLEALHCWNESKNSEEHVHYLNKLVTARCDIVKAAMNFQAWATQYLPHARLQYYLKQVTYTKADIRKDDSKTIKLLVRQLVQPSDVLLVKDLAHISQRIYHTGAIAPGFELADFMILKAILDRALEEMKSNSGAMYAESADQQGVRIKFTQIVAKAVKYMLNNYRAANQKYEELFLVTLLFPLNYDTSEKVFPHLLSTSDLEYLCEELEEQNRADFSETMKVQAYLFKTVVKLYNSELVSLVQSLHHLKYMQKQILNVLNPHVGHALINFYSGGYDWKELQSRLAALIQRDSPQMVAKLLEKATNAQMLFKLLGLAKYYPQKLTLHDALLVRHETLNMQQCNNLEILPFFILQKVMMYDYRCRTELLHHKLIPLLTSLPQSQKDVPYHSTDSDSDSGSDSDTDTNQTENESTSLHPMDGLLALLHCSNNFLRQDLMSRLSTCQLAVPLLLPDPYNPDKITLLLWGMRSIVKEWRCKDPKSDKMISKQSRIINHPSPVVTFFRFTRSRSTSKSRLMNIVMSNSKHDTFFHRECEGGTTKHRLMDGLVELSWFLPTGKPNDPLPDVVTFTNLRGDARQHPKQVKFLSQVSFMNVVLLTEMDLDERGMGVLQQLAQAPGGLELLFFESEGKEGKKDSLAEIGKSIRNHIKKMLSQNNMKVTKLADCAEIAHNNGMFVDEDTPECAQGRENVMDNSIQMILANSSDIVIDEMLPLQGTKMWHEWAWHDKEQHRHSNRGNKANKYEKERDKFAVRMLQLSKVEHLTPLMKAFHTSLLRHGGNIRRYFVQWLMFILDLAQEKLLRRKYQAKQNWLKQSKLGTDPTGKSLKDELEKPNKEFPQSFLGFEHFMREIGQMYETVSQLPNVSEQLRMKVNDLPQVAAEMLISGYPLELMDGDAAHVPIEWVMAVLGNLREQLGDARLFVLSVLGIQSTGKSTLLNTMFGLRFAVSAGRCTRGAFIQLVPLNETLRKRVNCDYLLVVDTEGLRAPELSSTETQKSNNELNLQQLATLFAGLANVTLVNIFGETPEIDVIPVAVHAFLQMKHVELQPSCYFVHQNVNACTASSQTKGRVQMATFIKELDNMTQLAAKKEGCEGKYGCFSDLMQFGADNVWYFPNLWEGDPTMAHVNPRYTEQAYQLKSHLLENIVQCSISNFQKHTEDMWKAVLHKRFTLSFKNSLEETTCNYLNAKGTWTREREASEISNARTATASNQHEAMKAECSGLFQKRKSDWERREASEILNARTATASNQHEAMKAECSGLFQKRKSDWKRREASEILNARTATASNQHEAMKAECSGLFQKRKSDWERREASEILNARTATTSNQHEAMKAECSGLFQKRKSDWERREASEISNATTATASHQHEAMKAECSGLFQKRKSDWERREANKTRTANAHTKPEAMSCQKGSTASNSDPQCKKQ